jgi:serine O-acetyltransferase
VNRNLPEVLWALSRQLHARGFLGLARGVKAVNWLIHTCLLAAEVKVGEGVMLEHLALGVIIHPQVEIGSNCRIYHHVTLASESFLGSPFKIVLGNDVTIGAHSIVVGRSNTNLTIGDGSFLGAGAVLTKNIPPGEVWAGNPAKKLRMV